MAILYKALTELYRETQRKVTAPSEWQAFLAAVLVQSGWRFWRLPAAITD